MVFYTARLIQAIAWNVRNTGRTWRARRFDVHASKTFNIKLNALWLEALDDRQGFIMIFDDQESIDRLLAETDPSLTGLRRYVSIMRGFESGVVVTVDELSDDIRDSVHGLTLDSAETDKALQLFQGTYVGLAGRVAKPVILRGDTIRYLTFFCPQCLIGGRWPAFIVQSWMFEIQQFQHALAGKPFVDPEMEYEVVSPQSKVVFPDLVSGTLVVHSKGGQSEITTVLRGRVDFTGANIDPALSMFVAEPQMPRLRCPCKYSDEPKDQTQRIMPIDVMGSR